MQEKRLKKEAAAAAKNTPVKQEPGRNAGSHPSTPTGSDSGSRVTTPGIFTRFLFILHIFCGFFAICVLFRVFFYVLVKDVSQPFGLPTTPDVSNIKQEDVFKTPKAPTPRPPGTPSPLVQTMTHMYHPGSSPIQHASSSPGPGSGAALGQSAVAYHPHAMHPMVSPQPGHVSKKNLFMLLSVL